MAVRALGVGVGKPEKGTVIKRRSQPCGGRVAALASNGETRRNVIWIRRRRVERLVTTVAIGRRRGEVAADVAAGAGNADVRSREWKDGLAVVEVRGRPGNCRVARGAGRGNSCPHVVRVGGAVEILDVTRGAVGGRAIEPAADVAHGAIQTSMRARQSESGDLQMVEFRSGPTVGQVAGFTRRREIHC